MRAGKTICEILIDSGIEWVFGVPGGSIISLFDSLYDYKDRMNVIVARHEQQASIMADAYGRIAGKPAVLAGQGAYIGTTGAFGILAAYLASSPMVVLTDYSEKDYFGQHGIAQCGTGEYGGFDLRNMLLSISKYVSVAVSPNEAVHAVQYALKHAISGRPGPACVIMRRQALTGEVHDDQVPRLYDTKGYLVASRPSASMSDIEAAVKLLLDAKAPVIIAGNGVHVSRAYEQLLRLSELLGIPVATSYLGKSTLPEEHPLALGLTGRFGQPLANRVVGEADIILVIGCSLSPDDTCYEDPHLIDPGKQKIIQIDIDARNVGWTYPVDLGILSDAKAALDQMVELVSKEVGSNSKNAKRRTEHLIKRKQSEGWFESPELYSDDIPILPQRLVRELNTVLAESVILFCDAGNNRLWTTHFFKTKSTRSFFGPGGIAGMGWAVPSAIAGKMLYPDSSCVAVCGDGGFAMAMHSLMTAVQYSVPIVVIVMNNSALGMIRDAQKIRMKGRIIGTEFHELDVVKIAEGIGCRGYKVTKPKEIAPVVTEALQSNMPSVVDIVVSRDENVYEKIVFKAQ